MVQVMNNIMLQVNTGMWSTYFWQGHFPGGMRFLFHQTLGLIILWFRSVVCLNSAAAVGIKPVQAEL